MRLEFFTPNKILFMITDSFLASLGTNTLKASMDMEGGPTIAEWDYFGDYWDSDAESDDEYPKCGCDAFIERLDIELWHWRFVVKDHFHYFRTTLNQLKWKVFWKQSREELIQAVFRPSLMQMRFDLDPNMEWTYML